MHLSKSQRVVAVAGPAVLSLLLGGLLFGAARSLGEQAEAVRATYAAETALESLLAELKDAESAARGLWLTGDERYWARQAGMEDRVLGHLSAVRSRVVDVRQLERLDSIAAAWRERQRVLNENMALYRAGGLVGEERVARLEAGRAASEAVREEIEGWKREQALLLGERDERARRHSTRLYLVVILGTLLSFSLALFVNSMLVRFASRQEETARELEDRNGALEEQALELEIQAEELEVQTEELEETFASLSALNDERSAVLDSAGRGILGMDLQGRCTFLNRAGGELLGRDPREAVGMEVPTLIHGDHHGAPHAGGECRLLEVLRTGTPTRSESEVFSRRGGDLFPVEYEARPIGGGGAMRGAVITFAEITERLRAAEELRERERTLSTLLSHLPGMVYRCRFDEDWSMEFVSEGCSSLTGYQPRELLVGGERSYSRLIVPDDRQRVRDTVVDAVAERRPFQLEYRLLRADGEERVVAERGQPVFHDDGRLRALEGFVTDVTEERRARERLERSEERLRQAQKMEAVGRLAGGIAHDFNNILGVIGGTTQLALMDTSPDAPVREDLEEISRATRRAADLTGRLLTFSRQQVLEPGVIDLNEIIGSTEKMLRRTLGSDIEFLSVLDPALWPVRADAGQIEQILLNLAINARDAMPAGGKLITETRNVDVPANYGGYTHAMKPGRYVVLSVSDTGEGMDEETRRRVFEPFFTTKEQGKGTGLGLATVYGIVKQSNGYIDVYSEVGFGTTLTIYLPRAHGAGEHAPQPEVVPTPTGELTGTILVVEDEPALRAVARRTLERAGYTVLEAENGERALDLLSTHEVDLLLTDVVMPRMNGLVLSRRACELRPRLQVLFTSGYTDQAIVQHQVLGSGAAFIQKPYAPADLVERVMALLGTDGEGG